jgi:hypothetical protein
MLCSIDVVKAPRGHHRSKSEGALEAAGAAGTTPGPHIMGSQDLLEEILAGIDRCVHPT